MYKQNSDCLLPTLQSHAQAKWVAFKEIPEKQSGRPYGKNTRLGIRVLTVALLLTLKYMTLNQYLSFWSHHACVGISALPTSQGHRHVFSWIISNMYKRREQDSEHPQATPRFNRFLDFASVASYATSSFLAKGFKANLSACVTSPFYTPVRFSKKYRHFYITSMPLRTLTKLTVTLLTSFMIHCILLTDYIRNVFFIADLCKTASK